MCECMYLYLTREGTAIVYELGNYSHYSALLLIYNPQLYIHMLMVYSFEIAFGVGIDNPVKRAQLRQ